MGDYSIGLPPERLDKKVSGVATFWEGDSIESRSSTGSVPWVGPR